MTLRRLMLDRGGSSAAEFALVLPMLLLFLFGIIDAGRYMWAINKAEKAAHMGVRMAVVTNSVAESVEDSYVGQCSLGSGDPIPANCFTQVTCTKTGNNASCSSGTADTAAFNRIVDRMQQFMPEIQDADVDIIYSPSGLGYAGDPNGPDVAPLVTVRLHDIDFPLITTLAFANLSLPVVRTSMTFEDGTGTASN